MTLRSLLVAPLVLLPACAAPTPAPTTPTAGTVRQLATDLGFTEGPVWLPDQQAVVFSDTPRARLNRWSEADGLTLYEERPQPNGNLLDLDGRLLSCQHGSRTLVRQEADGSLTVLADRYAGKRLNSPNDLIVGRDGTLWFTDPPWGLERQTVGKELDGHYVFRRDPDGTLTPVLTDRCMPNGIALSPDDSVLYVADTGGHRSHPDPAFHSLPATVSAWRIQPDKSLATEPLWQVESRCDGMAVDVAGYVYTTAQDAVVVFAPDGSEVCRIPMPEVPANCCFGGKDFTTLFVTARTSLYAVEVGIEGVRRGR